MSQLNPTLGDIEQDTILLLREFDGDEAAGDPITLRKSLLRAADEMARRSDCFWYAQSIAVVNGQADYCAPGLYKLRAVNYRGLDGSHFPLRVNRKEDMDRRGGLYASWRDREGSETPKQVATDGMNQISLYQTPIVGQGQAAAIEMEGYAVPSKCTKADGVTPLFAEPEDCWPLPGFSVDAVPFRIAMYRALQFAGDPVKSARFAMAKQEYERVLGDLCAFAATYNPPYRFGGPWIYRG